MISRMSVENFGKLLRSRRQSSEDPTTGKPWTQGRLADQMGTFVGESVSRSLVAGWERGEGETIAPKYINALTRILPITPMEALQALGYEAESVPLREDEREVLAAYRRLRSWPLLQEGGLAALKALQPRQGGRVQTLDRVAEPRARYEP